MSIITIQGVNEKAKGIFYEVNTDEPPLGVGGMGQVYKGCRIESNGVRIDVAIKFLFDDLPVHVIERARREASIQIHNENLVEMFGFIQIDDSVSPGVVHERYHVVSELLHGVMLYDLLKGKTTDNNGVEIPFAKELYTRYINDRYGFAIYIIKNVLSGIMALHDKGYIHRDIDPSNIMITIDGKVKIIDFGIARQLSTLTTQDKQLTTAGQFMGKAAYAAPELVVGDVAHQNETTDIYAIGIMFFQFIVGHLPFDGATHDVLNMQLHQKMPLQQVPQKQIRKIIGKATEKKQAERYQSAAEFRVAVEQLDKAVLVDESKSKPAVSLDTVLQNKKILISAAVLLLVLIGGFSLLHWRQSVNEEEMRQAQIERELMIAERKEKLKDEIIDSSDAFSKVDSLTGVTIKSAALLTNEAVDYLMDPEKADSGLKVLDKVITKKYRTSSDAAYLLGRLYYEDKDPSDTIQSMKNNLAENLQSSNKKAHELIQLALQLDTTSYKALYELGCDYYAGESRTGGLKERSIENALECFEKGLKFAVQANDKDFEDKCAKRIKELTPYK